MGPQRKGRSTNHLYALNATWPGLSTKARGIRRSGLIADFPTSSSFSTYSIITAAGSWIPTEIKGSTGSFTQLLKACVWISPRLTCVGFLWEANLPCTSIQAFGPSISFRPLAFLYSLQTGAPAWSLHLLWCLGPVLSHSASHATCTALGRQLQSSQLCPDTTPNTSNEQKSGEAIVWR